MKVGLDFYENNINSFVYFYSHTEYIYLHLWRGGVEHREKMYYNRPHYTKYKVQLIQSTFDDKSCRQELKINDRYLWQKHLRCPRMKTGIQEIYTCGSGGDTSKAQITNFKFFSHPLNFSVTATKRPTTTSLLATQPHSPIFEKNTTFNVSTGFKIGEIRSYHHNYEFSMEVKHQVKSYGYLLQGNC